MPSQPATSQDVKTSHDGEPLPTTFDFKRFEEFDASAITSEPVAAIDGPYARFGGRCLLLRNVITADECSYLISQMSENLEPVRYRHDYRCNDRRVFSSIELADILWRRVAPFAQGFSISVGENVADQKLLGFESTNHDDSDACPEELRLDYGSEGLWTSFGLNECLRFCRYSSGGFFRAHCDGCFKRSEDERSLFTCMFYLDDNFEGGATRFLKINGALTDENYLKLASDESVLATIRPEPGLCILFFQPGLLHEGEDLVSGFKHILRTDVLFKRDPTTKIQRTPQQIEAWKLIEEAQAAEARGDCDEAWPLYRRAFKLDPRLERML